MRVEEPYCKVLAGHLIVLVPNPHSIVMVGHTGGLVAYSCIFASVVSRFRPDDVALHVRHLRVPCRMYPWRRGIRQWRGLMASRFRSQKDRSVVGSVRKGRTRSNARNWRQYGDSRRRGRLVFG